MAKDEYVPFTGKLDAAPQFEPFDGTLDGEKPDGPIARGWNKAKQSMSVTSQLATGNAAGAAQTIKQADDYARANPGMQEGKELGAAWERGDGIVGGISEAAGEFAKDWREAPGVIKGLRATGRNLRALGEGIVEQVPNMVAPVTGMVGGALAGGAAGSAAPIVGNVAGAAVGGWVGASAGNTLVEGGGMTQAALQKAGINPQDTAAVEKYLTEHGDTILGQSATKGAIIGAVDTLTAGLGGRLLNAPARAAADRALAGMGVNMADKAAVKAATQSPEFAAKIAGDATYQASKQGAGNIARNVGVAALDPAGEFAGEFVGQGVTTGEWDTKNAALEAFSSIGQSGAMFTGQKAYQALTRPAGADDPNAPQTPPTTPPEAPDLTTAPGAGVAAVAGAPAPGQPPQPGPVLGLPAPDRGVIEVAGDGTARTPAYQAPGYVGDVTDVEPRAVNPVREQVAAAAEQGGALSSIALTAIDTGLSDAMQPAPEQAPPQISLEEADARDQAAYEQFFANLDAEPVVGRYVENDNDIPDFDAASNVRDEDFLRSLDPTITDQEIQDAIATSRQPTISQSSAASNAGPQAYEPAGPREGAGEGAASQTGQVNAGAIQQAAPDAPVPGVGEPVGADGAGSAAAAVFGASGAGGAGTGAATGSGAGATEAGAARAGGRGNSNPALSAPTNLREGLARMRASRQEAADAQTAAQSAPTSAPAVSTARPGAVEAAGAAPFPATTGVNREPSPTQAIQASAQPAQAPATQGLTNAATPQNNGAQDPPAAGAQAQAPGNASWAALTPEQRRRARLEHEIATGQTNNGGVVAGLRHSAIEKRKQELAAMGDAGKLPSPGPAEPLSADGLAAQGQAAPGAQGAAQAAQAGVAPRPKNWRTSMLGATPVAKAMGIDTKGKRLAQVVAEIDARDTQAPATPAPAPAPGQTRLGRDNTPLGEGGKPFKTRKAAGDAKKLQPMMRVVTVPGGYALAEKTPAQLAAEERASRRLRNPNTSARGEPIPAHAFIAAAGGLSRVAASDMGVDGNPRIGNRTLFAGQGRGLSMDQATQMLIQDGYLSEGATINDALALIKKSLTQPQYNADGIERIAQAEADAQFEDYLAAQEEAAADGDTDPFGMADEFTAEELDEVGYTAADPALQAEVSALIAQAEAMDIDTFAILEDIARTYANATQDQYNAAARDALAQAIARSNQDGGSTAAQAAPAAESAADQGLDPTPALELASQTPAEAAAQQEAQEQAAKAEAARQRAADAQAARDEERKRIAQASVRAADSFELGQDPLDSLTGQGSIFDAPEQAAEDNYLDTLFGGDSESASAAQAAPSKRKIDAKKIVPALRQLAGQKRAEADDWMGRVYRNNTTQIDLRGDGPSRQDSMSTNSVNESRRRRAVEALTQQANAASKLADRVENGTIDLQSRLGSISDTVDGDMRRDGGKPMIGSSRADMFEGYISNNLFGDDNYGHGKGTVARMLREAYEVAEQAPPEDLAEQAAQPITRADVEDAQQQAATLIGERIDAMTAGEVNTIARRFLPTMGVRPTVSKERNKAAVTDFTKVSPLAAAEEFGAALPADVRRVLQADMEGRVTGQDGPMFSRAPAAFSFAGQQAVTADQHALTTAQQRLDAGEDAEAVRQDTGWFKGTDGKWRFEINDADAKLLKEPSDPGVYADIFDEAASRSNGVPLGKVLDHPALFAAYPALKATRFIVDDKYSGNGSYSADENAIRVRDPYSYKNGPDQLLSVLLHEIQHGIQDIEGFASGGSPNEFRDESADAEMLRDGAILAVMMRSQGTIEKAKALFVQRFKREPAFGSESAALSGESPESMRARADNALAPHERYRRLAGEVEARNTQARQGMTDEQRRATPPSQTADVADSRVIVMFNGKEMANAPMPANAAPDAATTAQPLRTPAATIRAAITKAYGKLLGQLESKGLVTLTQTEDEAIEAAAQARAAKTGQSVEQARSTLRASVKNSVADQTQAENFQRWFKDSKAVDANGRPLVVYHGTHSSFTEFKPNDALGGGMFFSPSPEEAGAFTGATGSNIMPVYLSAQKVWPKIVRSYDEVKAIRAAKSKGYDAIRVRDDQNGVVNWVVFDPTQVKSATGNNGDFDPANPDIRRSADGSIQGFFDPQTGQSFLIADNLTAEAAPGVLMHEVGIHMAADGSMKALFNRAAMMLKLQRGNPFMKAVQDRMDAAGETSGEEAAAYIAEAYENDRANAPASVQRWLADLLAAVKAWMFKKGIMGADRLTVADIAAVARANARSMARDGGATGWQGFGPAFSVGEEVGAKALAEFAKADELFALPKSTKDTVEGIAADNDAQFTVSKPASIGGRLEYTVTLPDGTKATLSVREPNPFGGEQVYDARYTDDGMELVPGRPGENPDDVPPTGDVWIDVSDLKKGDFGAKMYNIAATYAHNTGRIFIGDPHGLSKDALRRRLEQMISSALKFGTTAHLAPHPDQTRGGHGVPPLRWVYGDHVGNVERMIAASVKALDNGFPQSKLIEYRDGNFYNANNGKLLPRGRLATGLGESIAQRRSVPGAEGSTAQAGWRTVARAALFRHFQSSIMDAASGIPQRGSLLARGGKDVSRLERGEAGEGAFDANERIFYSRAGVNTGGQAATGWDAPVQTGFDDVIYKLQDKNIDLKRVVEAITKSVGQVSDSINAYLKEELFHKRAAKRVADFGDRELKPLMNKMRLAGLSMEDVEEYLHARHAKEANAVIAQRNPGNAGLQDGGSGMTNQAADNYFSKLDPAQRRKLEAVAKNVDAIIDKTRKLYVSYGLENQDVVDGWASMYQHYIPLMREDKDGGMGTGQGFSVKGKETKGRTGSTRKVVDILANVAMQREKLIVRGEKNIVAQALVGLAQANPNPDFWEVRSQAPTERVFDPKTGVVVDRPDPLFKSRDNVVVAKVQDSKGNVTEQMVVFNEDNPRAVRMAAAMKNLDAGNLEGLLGMSAKITRYFSAINTQYNPVFGVVNLVRDVQGAMVNLAATPLAGQQGKIARDTVSALAGIYSDIRKTRKGGQATSKWAQLWEQMQDDGGTTGYRELFTTSADRANNLKSILNPEAWMDNKWGKVFTADGKLRVPMSMAQKGASEIFGWLSDYNEAMENGVRLAAYKAALDKGMSREQAASLAKNLTVNFNRKGQVGMQAGAVYAFFNAAMQGTARIGQTLFDMDGGDISTLRLSKTGKAVVYGGVTLGVMQALALAGAGFDEEDPPEFVRERSLIIPTGGKTYVSIPMPLGLHVIPGIGRHATEFALSGFDKPAKRALSVIGMFADAFNPIGNAGLSMQTLAPTALDPLVALTENKDWTGKPIARVSFNKALPGHTQWKDTATWYSKMAAEAINWVSGGNEYVAGALSPTPDQIDYLVAQVGGGVAREASKVFQAASTTVNGEELPTYKIPLLGRFAGNAASQASQGTAFYANLDRLNALETEIKGLRKDGRFGEAAQLARENPQAAMIPMANRAERDVQKLRRDKRELIATGATREEVRAKEVQITAVMARLNEAAARRKATAPE